MSSFPSPRLSPVAMPAEEALVIDEARFTRDGGDLYLLDWLRNAEKAIEALDDESLLKALQSLHSFFLKLVTSPSTLPKPGRPVRHLMARCINKLHAKVESRSLFDFVQALMRSVSDTRATADSAHKVASWYLIGEIIQRHGANLMSFTIEICTLSVKVLKSTALSVVLRYHAVDALQKALHSTGKAVTDQSGREVVKGLKNGLADKAGVIQRASAEALIALASYTPAVSTLGDMEALIAPSLKSVEMADYTTRRALSRLIAHLLASTQAAGSAITEEPKKAKKAPSAEEADSGPTVITSAANHTAKTLLTPVEMFKQLSVPFNRPNSSRRLRNAIFDVYATLLSTLGASYVESHYAEIIKHFVDDIVTPPRSQSTRREVLSVRDSVGLILRDLIGVRLLTEQGQVAAIRELVNNYIKKWPNLLPGVPPVHKQVLILCFKEVAGLMDQLGNVPASVQELLGEPLVRALAHPSHSVRVTASYCLRHYAHANPSQLSKLMEAIITDLTRDLSLLGTPTAPQDLAARTVGRAYGLSSLIAISTSRPLYVPSDVSSRVFDMSVSLLKRAGEQDVAVARVQVQVAWCLISSLMSLGPGFVKLHLPQLLVLWRNALPKPSSKDTSVGERGEAEWSFLLLVRECTLSAVLSFLRHNHVQLVNIDVARRIATMLSNTLNFVNGFATAYGEALREQTANPSGSSSYSSATRPSLVERESMLRRRVLQCFNSLGASSATETMQPALLQSCITVFADPENYSGSAAQAAIAASAGQFSSVWQASDCYGFGVTSLFSSRETLPDEGSVEDAEDGRKNFLNRDSIEMAIEQDLFHPVPGAIENDVLELCCADTASSPPVPSSTGVVDAGVTLFSTIFPHQSAETQVQTLAVLTSHIRSSKLERNPGRKQAVLVNTVAAVHRALANAESAPRKARDNVGSAQVADMLRALLQEAVLDPVVSIRVVASEGMGLLASFGGSAQLTGQVQWLVDQVVNNRSPDSRAGCALAFGSIYSRVGGLAAGPILKTIVNILMSLATDPHPVVHFWAMSALSRVINAASLSYSPYVSSTLGMLANIYLLETHEPEGGSVGSVNLRSDLPAYQVICRILHALVGVLGPELQEPGKVRNLVFLLVHEFGHETDEGIAVEAIKCVQQFLMFAPGEVDVPELLSTFRSHLRSTRRPLKVAAITALYQIVQRDAPLMSKLGGNELVEDLFGLLDDDPSIEGVRNVITSWLKQTAASMPSGWIDLCQRIMTRTAATAAAQKAAALKAKSAPTAGGFQDDEGESLGGDISSAGSTALSSRWRTQLFALNCLHDVVQAVKDAGKPEQFDPVLARRLNLNPRTLLVSRVADLIRMAFSASAALVMDVRLQGLVVLRDVIENFASAADPDFESSLLLEQHQAPIAAALTPSFSSDSTPEVLASAVQVCAVFVGSGVIKEVSRMGRILKLLTSALEQCKEGESLLLGDVEDLSSSAAVMLKISILTAWAELQVRSSSQEYLKAVIQPYRWLLAPFWIGSLRDYAQLRTDPEASMGGSSMDMGESGLGRDVLLPYYERASLQLLHAVASALSTSDPFIIGAMDGQTFTSSTAPQTAPSIRSEPCPSFYVVYGLAFETLAKAIGTNQNDGKSAIALRAIKSLVNPVFSGLTVFEGAFFDELITLCYRVAMSEPSIVKKEMVAVVAAFAVSRSSASSATDSSQIRRCLAVIVHALRTAIPTRDVPTMVLHGDPLGDRVAFLRAGFTALCDVVSALDASERADLYAVGVHLYSDLLKDETPNADLAGPTLPALKQLLDHALSAQIGGTSTFDRTVHGLLSGCLTNIDDMRAREGQVATTKIKNNMLACVLVLTTLPANVQISRPVVEQVCYSIGQHLGDTGELSINVVYCAKTLLLAAQRGNPLLQHCYSQLIPAMVNLIASVAQVSDEISTGDARLSGADEVIKALIGFVQSLDDGKKPGAYGILLPTLVLLLDPEGTSPTAVHLLAVKQLLALATQSPTAFKAATNGLDGPTRSRLETAIRQSVSAGQAAMAAASASGRRAEAQIELKSFG